MTEYVRKRGTNEIFVKTEYLMKRGDMEPCDGPNSPPVKTVAVPAAKPTREATIREAVAKIDVKDYAKASFGRPAMPRIATVSEIAGFEVTKEEIAEAMGATK